MNGARRSRWTPRAKRLAAALFIVGALGGFVAALLGAVCDHPSVDCLRNEGKDAVRIALIALPFIAYAIYRFTRSGPGPGPGSEDGSSDE